MKNGFYWVICELIDSEPQIAEYVDGEWFFCGFERAFDNEFIDIYCEVRKLEIEYPSLKNFGYS